MNVIQYGPNRATGVQVSFTLPAPVTLVTARFNFIGGPSIDCASNTTTVSCNIGSVDSGNLAGAAVVVVLRAQATGVLRGRCDGEGRSTRSKHEQQLGRGGNHS